MPDSLRILGMRLDATSYPDAAERILGWARARESRYLCAASVNNVMEAHDSRAFLHIMNDADLVTPDGMPLVWGLRMLGAREATRVYGPDLTPVVRRRYPTLEIAYACAPPFRPLSASEDAAMVSAIRASGARILFVGLSTPKQERWMAAHRGSVPTVMLGVGAAFDFLSGVKPQAPAWMQASGLEWLFRLATEPRRLFWRYLKHNPRFVALFAWQLLTEVRHGSV